MSDPPSDTPQATPTPTPGSAAGAADEPAVAPAVPELLAQPTVVLAVVALAALVTLSGFAGAPLVALSLAFASAVLAWGWAGLLGLPSPRGTAFVLAVAAVASIGTVLLTRADPFLRWMPAAAAGSMIVAFLHQLVRRDGRPRLVESMASTITGVAIIVSGASLVPLPRALGGSSVLAVAMSAVGVAALVELVGRWPALRGWLTPLALVAGAGVAAVVGLWTPSVPWTEAALIGLVSGGVSHIVRRVFALLPAMSGTRPQLVSASASVLIVGVAVYVVGRLLVG